MRNWFLELSKINVNDKIEEKNGLKYLSWAYAWSELKKLFPLSYATVHESPEGLLIWKDPVGCHVKTSVTIVWDEEDGKHEHTVTEYLPVMDFKNKSVPYDSADSMIINKTIQRSLTKCIGRLGLGGYIYAGEDMPEEDTEELTNTIKDIEKECARITKNMNQAAKTDFAKSVIFSTIGQLNYKSCKNIENLHTLLDKLKNTKAAA